MELSKKLNLFVLNFKRTSHMDTRFKAKLQKLFCFFCQKVWFDQYRIVVSSNDTHLWPFSKGKFSLKCDSVNLVAPASPNECLLYLPNVQSIQYKLGPERLTRIGNSNVLRLPVMETFILSEGERYRVTHKEWEFRDDFTNYSAFSWTRNPAAENLADHFM